MSKKGEYLLLENEQPRTFLVNLRPRNKINIPPSGINKGIKDKLNELITIKKQKLKSLKTFGTPIFVYKTERENPNGKKEYVMVVIKNNRTSIKTSSKPFKTNTKKKEEKKLAHNVLKSTVVPVASSVSVASAASSFSVSSNSIKKYLNNISRLIYVSPEKPIDNPGQKCFIIASYHLLFSIFWQTNKRDLILGSYKDSEFLSNLIESLLTGKNISNDLVNKVTDELINKNTANKELQKFKTEQCDSHEFLINFFKYFNNTYEQIKGLITFNTLEKYVLEDKTTASPTYTNIKRKYGKLRTKSNNKILIIFNNKNKKYHHNEFYDIYSFEKSKNKYFYITQPIYDKFISVPGNGLFELNKKVNGIKGITHTSPKTLANRLSIEPNINPIFQIRNSSNLNNNNDLFTLISSTEQTITKNKIKYNAGTVFKEECKDCQILKDPNVFIKNIYYIKPINFDKLIYPIGSITTKKSAEEKSQFLVKKYYTKILDDFLNDVEKVDLSKNIDNNFVIHLTSLPNDYNFGANINITNKSILEVVEEWKINNLERMKQDNLKDKTITISLGYDEKTKNNIYKKEILENKIENDMIECQVEDKDMNIEEILLNNLNYEKLNSSFNIDTFIKNLDINVSKKNNIHTKKYFMNLPDFLIIKFANVNYIKSSSSSFTTSKINNFHLTNNLNDIIKIKEMSDDLITEKDIEYNIQDVIYHQGGSSGSGHYICLSKRKNEKEPENIKSKTNPTEKWFLYSDSNVSDYSGTDLKIANSNPVLVLLKKKV